MEMCGSVWGLILGLKWYELCVAVCSYVLIHLWTERKRNGNGAPPCWPVMGMLPSLLINMDTLYDWLTGLLNSTGGTFVFRGPWLSKMQSIVTCDPRNIEYVLGMNFPNYPKGPEFHLLFQDLLGDGIFTADSESWRLQRKIAILRFNSRGFRLFAAQTVEDMVETKLLPLLADVADRNATVDLQDVFLRYTFDNTCTSVFGMSPGCLAKDLPEVPFAKAFDDAVEATLYRHVMPRFCWLAFRLLKLGKERQFSRALKPLREFVDDLIASKKKTIAGVGETQDLLSSLMHNSDPILFTDKFLRDTIMNLVIAGRDTSGVALTWFFWALSRHPQVEKNILEEIGEVLKKRCGDDDLEKAMTSNELQECVYLHAALTETLRLYPSVPLDHKGVLQRDLLPDGRVIKPGMRFMYSIYSLGRMESIWGSDCLEFKPERWIERGRDGKMRVKKESMYKFLAFNAGPRICLGKEMAYMQMKAAAAGILRRFRVRVVQNHKVQPKISLILAMKYGLRVTVCRRESNQN